ncbi:flagellar biosynthetic protein FliQ [Caloramator quimbayensis]|uniref:Flagellar biosynthetic protein FliQ n=1 Tax=Caloramator quimbayensis TaxID=1147123 RepID=A0A1T4XA57_9CLOT|nr:flagellar biosynthesis protein FliQ [Caloramator quimbayensis]SKA86453.1 flagellar biosynthetic protein FliQ [Caloramator quimbayensis]
MSEAFALEIGKQAIFAALKIAAPVLIVSMLIGLLIGIFQAATQIQEQTLTFVPKIISIIFVMLLLGPWMLKSLVQFIQSMINNIGLIVK